MDTVVLIPAYNPDEALVTLVKELSLKNRFSIVIVNDGSALSSLPYFEQTAPYATVIGYEKNQGKGYALKFGMQHILNAFPDASFVITADADGQHAVSDILRTADTIKETGSIVLGSRAFTGKVPFRSRIGNDLSRFNYAISTRHYLSDNQSGLRGFAISLLPWLITISGNQYDYEMNVLLHAAKCDIPMFEMAIHTIYLNQNKSSHFRPLPDTFLIQKRIFSSAAGSFIGLLLSLLFLIFFPVTPAVLSFGYSDIYLLAANAMIPLFGEIFNRIAFSRYHLGKKSVISLLSAYFIRIICSMLMAHFLLLPLSLCYLLSFVISLFCQYALQKKINPYKGTYHEDLSRFPC